MDRKEWASDSGREMISIVVPIYNSEKFLLRCIRSLQRQSYGNLEILLVDDGSQDNSLAICRREAAGDSRIRVIHQENGGVASARNAGMAAMTGKWLMLIDADDFIHPDMARDLLRAAKEEDAQAAVCGFMHVFPGKKRGPMFQMERAWSGSRHAFAQEMLLPLYRNLLLRTQSNKLYLTEIIRKHHLAYPGEFSINEDIWFCVRYLTYCRRIACIPGSYLYYWQNMRGESQISRYHPEGVESCFLLLSAMELFLDRAKASPKVRMQMDNEMLFHLCGFAGHSYYRVIKPNRECYQEIVRMSEREEMRGLLARVRPNGLKNGVAKLLLENRHYRAYHWLCLLLYGRQRARLRKKLAGEA